MSTNVKGFKVIFHNTVHILPSSARQSFAITVTLANKVSMESASKMLGHASINMTKRYARILASTISQEIGLLAEKLQMN